MAAAERAAPRAPADADGSLLPHPRQSVLGAAFGVGATGLAFGGHVLAGGAAPAVAPLAAITLTAAVASVALSRMRWRLPSLLGALLVMQAAFHVAFGSLAGPSTHAGHAHAGHPHGHTYAEQSGVTAPGWQMLAVHVVAVLVTAFVIRRGAQICDLFADVLASPLSVVRVLLSPAPSLPVTRMGVRATCRAAMLAQLVLCAAPRRGPPALLAS